MPSQNNGPVEAQIIIDFHANGVATMRFGGTRRLHEREFDVVLAWFEQHIEELVDEEYEEPIQ